MLGLWFTLKVLLIAGGGHAEINNQTHLNHLLNLKSVLEDHGIDHKSLYIFWADGRQEGLDRRLPDPKNSTTVNAVKWMVQHTPWELWFENQPHLAHTQWDHPHIYPATKEALKKWIEEIGTTVAKHESILIAVTDHGRPDPTGKRNSEIHLWHETLKVSELSLLLDRLPKTLSIHLWMSQCFSGGFADLALKDDRICGVFSAHADRPAYGCFESSSLDAQKGHFSHMIKGFKKYGRLDLASDYTALMDLTPDTPHLASDSFLATLTQQRAEALGIPTAHLVDTALPRSSQLNSDQKHIAQTLSKIALRFGLGRVHSLSHTHTILKQVHHLKYTLETWMGRWNQLLQEAKLRLLAQSPIDGEIPKLIAHRRRGKIRLTHWLKKALKQGKEGRRGLLKDLKQKVDRSQKYMDQLLTLESALLRISHLYHRLSAPSLLQNPHDQTVWRRMQKCEQTPMIRVRNPQRKRKTFVHQDEITPQFASLTEIASEIEQLRPGHLAFKYREHPQSKRVQVKDLQYGSPLAAFALKAGDWIESLEGLSLEYVGQLQEQIALHPIGEFIRIRTRRKKQRHTYNIPIVGMPLSPPPPKRGEQIPPLNLKPIFEGQSLDYLYTGGRPSLLFFWSTWCTECLALAPRLHQWALKHDLQVLAITTEDPKLVRVALKKQHFPFSALHDQSREVSRLFHVNLQTHPYPIFVYLDVERRFIEQGQGWGKQGPKQIEVLFE